VATLGHHVERSSADRFGSAEVLKAEAAAQRSDAASNLAEMSPSEVEQQVLRHGRRLEP
jgi:hypothetical protein